MMLAPKLVECRCGNSFTTTKNKTWCEKCCRPVFYHKKDQRRNRFNNAYITTMILMVLTFITYIFIEMIAEPLMKM